MLSCDDDRCRRCGARIRFRMGCGRAMGWIDRDRLVRRGRRSLAHAAARDIELDRFVSTERRWSRLGFAFPAATPCTAVLRRRRRWDDGDRGDQRITRCRSRSRSRVAGCWRDDRRHRCRRRGSICPRCGDPSDRSHGDADGLSLAQCCHLAVESLPSADQVARGWWRRRSGQVVCNCRTQHWSRRSPRHGASCC